MTIRIGVCKMISVQELLNPRFIQFMDAESKADALNTMIDMVSADDNVMDKAAFRRAVLDREAIFSTGIGLGIAIPHVKIREVKNMVIGIGINSNPIDWKSIDSQPVRIIFLIAGSEDQHEMYLRILAKIILVLKNKNRREKLLAASNPQEIMALFQNI